MDVPLLEEAVQLMQDVPKEANDHMALSMIDGYEGNIHANGQIILQVRERERERERESRDKGTVPGMGSVLSVLGTFHGARTR